MKEVPTWVRSYDEDARRDVNTMMGYSASTDQSSGSRCYIQTRSFQLRAEAHGILLRRELHRDELGNWHYVIAHSPPDTEPTETDTITDLNPWQFSKGKIQKGLLHGPRAVVMEALQEEGASDIVLALRGLETLVLANDTQASYD